MAALQSDVDLKANARNIEVAETPDKAVQVTTQEDIDDDPEYTRAEQRKIVHKIDRRILPVLGLMQTVSFLDRANLSNAAVAGMTEDLGLEVGARYSIVLLVFFAPYIAFQLPSTAVVRKLGPRMFLSTIVLAWGIVMMCFGFVNDWKVLIALRILLGALEAGSFPGQYYLISSWYTRFDMHKRISIYYLVGVLGSALGGVFGLLFSQMDGLGNLAGWRWIFIMEGLITCLIGAAGYVFTVDFPEKAHKAWGFLTEEECAFVIRRINRDRQDGEPERFSLKKFLKPALDLKIWTFALRFFCSTIQAYSIGFYLPIILQKELLFSTNQSQGLSTPPYLCAMLLMFVEGWISDRYRLRVPIVWFNAIINIIGLCLMCWGPSAGVQYFGSLLVTAGSSSNIPALMAWQANNLRGPWKRAFSSASLLMFGGMGGIAGSLVFRSQDAPKYLPGIYACLTANGLTLLASALLVVYFLLRNRRADQGFTIIEDLPGFRFAI